MVTRDVALNRKDSISYRTKITEDTKLK